MANHREGQIERLKTEIAASDRYAADLVRFAADMHAAGCDEGALKLLKLSRQYRVTVLGLQGKLAAATMRVE